MGSRLISGRFLPEAMVGSGGMGIVYRARDQLTGETVALKLLHGLDPLIAARFRREAKILGQLSHPSIVRTVAFGTTSEGEQYLAMEWLEGHDLRVRLEQGAIELGQTLRLGQTIAGALAHAHARGIVHRDIKPSNLFLVGGDLERVMILDFGVARLLEDVPLTATGMLVGTPAYMSPEQVRGERELDERTDLFSLGCVLAECLTGKRLFMAATAERLLAKILHEDIGEPEAWGSIELGKLIAHMLAKDPAGRPASAAVVEAALAEIASGGEVRAEQTPQVLGRAEQRLIAVVLTARPDPAGELTEIQRPIALMPDSVVISKALDLGGAVDVTANGTIIASFAVERDDEARDVAGRACRLAIIAREAHPGRPTAVVTGGAVYISQKPVGELIEAAAAMAAGSPPGTVALDDATRGLIDPWFETVLREEGWELAALRPPGAYRAGSPWIGREAEIAVLEAAYTASLDEGRAATVLVIGRSDVGKSRLAAELITHLSMGDSSPVVWAARGEPRREEPRYSLIARLLRSAIEGDARLSQDAVLRQLSGLRGLDNDLRAAQQDRGRWENLHLRALSDVARERSASAPLVLLLDDLQWADVESLNLLDEVLARLGGCPIFVIGLARPEIEVRHVDLWSRAGCQRIHLRPLGRKACERLAALALGAGERKPGDLERLVEDSAGLPGRVLELARAFGTWAPSSVVAALRAGIERLPDEARRLLRAASVFGLVAPLAGAATLCGADEAAVGTWVKLLVDADVVVDGGGALVFRDELTHAAAYAMLTDADRRLGHRLAGRWLEGSGGDPELIADHLERGHQRIDAASFYLRAAEMTYHSGDTTEARRLADRGLSCRPPAETRERLEALRAKSQP